MKKRWVSLLLALVMCLGLLPATASAAEANLPDWNFLFAIFKNVDADYSDVNDDSGHTVYTMTQDEIDMLRNNARELEEFLSQVGVIRPHVDVVEIDTPITELEYSNVGSYFEPEQAAPLLADAKVDLNQYDHVFCIASLNVNMSAYTGATGAPFENGTGQSFINTVNLKYWTYMVTHRNPVKLFNHEFLHFMEQMSSKWGSDFRLHLIGDKFYANDASTAAQTDIMLNRVKGDAESGTGIAPVVWQYPPHVLRTMTELFVPSGVTGIGMWAFQNSDRLTRLSIPSSVTDIAYNAFGDCDKLAEVIIQPGLTSIGGWAFGECPALTRVAIPASVTSIGECAFYSTGLTDVYYGGTEEQWKAIQIGGYNEKLTRANIHYNSSGPSGTVWAVQISQDRRSVTAIPNPSGLLADCEAVYAASYDANGRFAGVVRGRLESRIGLAAAAFQDPVPAGGRLFFLDGGCAPVCAPAQIPQ